MSWRLSLDVQRACEALGEAHIVVGIPSFNNVRTIARVVEAASLGLGKYFPQYKSVILNSDGGSTDGTREAVESLRLPDTHLLLVDTPIETVHRLSFPYHGIPGKGSALRMVFATAERLHAKAVVVVDSDLRSISPEWFDLLLRPVLFGGFDFVAPYYHRHKYDGTITNSIVYPLTRTLYGRYVRQPIGGEFAVSRPLFQRYLQRSDWETDVARFGIDIWMSTVALAEGYSVAQSYLGAKLHDAKDPALDLTSMLVQVTGSLFSLMREYEPVWMTRTVSEPAPLFGFRFDVGLEPVHVDVERMKSTFRRAHRDLREIWEGVLSPATWREVERLARQPQDASFHLEDEVWAHIVMDFACESGEKSLERSLRLRSFTPLYLARVASFVEETRTMLAGEVEERIEQLCLAFEREKSYLIARWEGEELPATSPREQSPQNEGSVTR